MSLADPASESADSDDLLASWKEIASYLGRSVRAVQNWEKDEGLPVHRHHHDRQGSVFALRSEIDAWLKGREQATREAGEPGVVESLLKSGVKSRVKSGVKSGANRPRARNVGAWPVIVAAAGLFAFSAAAWWIARDAPESRAIALEVDDRAWTLVSQIDNRAGDPLFDGSLEYLLERELTESPRLSIVSHERVGDALRLMRRSPDTRIDRAVAREVALRDGAIRLVVSPRVERFGRSTIVGADLIDPASGEQLARFTEEAGSIEGLPGAIRRLGRRLRQAVGEKVTRRDHAPALVKVTTPSLEALQLFTAADRVIAYRDNAAAEQLLLRAIEKDPEFASAHMHLAFAIANQARPSSDYLPHAQRAAELSSTISDRERYFILGGYANMREDPTEALRHYTSLLQIDPDHWWATNNIGMTLKFRMGRAYDAVPYRVRLAELRPHEPGAVLAAAEALQNWTNHPERAQPYFDRALELIEIESSGLAGDASCTRCGSASEIRMNRAHRAWVRGDREGIIAELEKWTAAASSMTRRDADALLQEIGHYELAIGRIEHAERLLGMIAAPPERTRYAAHLHYAKGGCARAAEAFERHLKNRHALGPSDGVPMMRCGVISSPDSILELPAMSPMASISALAAAELEARRSGRPDAFATLEQLVRRSSDSGSMILPYQLSALGTLLPELERQGRTGDAIALLEASDRVKIRLPASSKLQWIELQKDLVRLYRSNNQLEKAETLETMLQRMTGSRAT
ncbi:MAG TPA: tetratricopeptide repeat protein [Thermoanaerobaculia bacterium]|nr:tetratricopeptide repeat protein [Thermoanaerobaculia bacterium]